MNTLILTMSPRKSFSTSMYLSKVLRFFLKRGQATILELKTKKQYLQLKQQLHQVDNLVFVTPVYVDTIPSTVLDVLSQIQQDTKDKNLSLNIYAITNCGFYEGEQCQLAQNTFKLWSQACSFEYKGGLGVGAGVMLGFIRTLIPIGLAVTLAEILIRCVVCLFLGNFTPVAIFSHFFPYTLVIQTALYLLWSMGLFINTYKMARRVQTASQLSVRYTTLWFCPRFLFVMMASIYWVLASIFWYRGSFWRLLKEPKF